MKKKQILVRITLIMVITLGLFLLPGQPSHAAATNKNPKLPKASDASGITVKPDIRDIDTGTDMVLASYSTKSGPNKLLLDLTTVLKTYKKNKLPNDGVYGYGNCDGAITVQAVDSSGKSIGKIKTSGKEFMLNFPGAQKIMITGEVKNLVISFTPAKPIVITDTVFFASSDIDWLSPDGNARQYFILPPYTLFNFYSDIVQTPYFHCRQNLEYGNTEPEEFSNGYQLLAMIFLRDKKEFCADTACGLEFRSADKVIKRSNVIVYDTKENKQADNYETKLIKMIKGLKTAGLNKYFPSAAWDKTLNIRVQNGIQYGGPDFISICPEDTDLKEATDYMVHLHEMTHYYEQQTKSYGIWISAWAEGNAVSLSRLALKTMKIDENGSYDLYNTDWSFLTEADKKDFENYYLTVDDLNAYKTGYHFNCYLREKYGEDIIYRITKKAVAAHIPSNQGKSEEWSKKFADCIKAETSKNVFKDFIKNYVNK